MTELRPAIEVVNALLTRWEGDSFADHPADAPALADMQALITADRRALVDAIVVMLRGHAAIVGSTAKKSRVNEYDRAISMGWVKGTNDAADMIAQRFGGTP